MICRHVAQGESAILTRWMSRVQIPACLPFNSSTFPHVNGSQVKKGISKGDQAVPFLHIDSLGKLIFYVTGPFNLLKGLVISVVTYLIYPYLSPLLKKGRI